MSRPLPTCEPERSDESVVDHGARVLTFLLETSCTATLSDRELQHADLAAHYAVIARGISVTAVDKISDVRHVIAVVLKNRQPAADTTPTVDGGQLAGGRAPSGGYGDREPIAPRPRSNPPAGAYASRDRVQF
jgi:hypothetical protein